jgi:hypothetical protein
MARRGILDYILGGTVGGLEGLAQQRAAEDEKKRMADALARQTRMDTEAAEDRTYAREDREQAKKDRFRSQRERLLTGGYVPKGMDMPGATPRKAVSTEMVDGQEYNLYSTPRQMAIQAAMEEAELKAKFKPEDKMTAYQKEMIEQRKLDRAARGRSDASASSDKTNKAGIDKVIAGAGKVVAASRAEEKAAETQLARLDRERPDPNRFTGTDEELAAAEAAWQKKVAAVENRLEAAQGKTARVAPTYERSEVTRDTTGYGEAFGPPAAPAAPARQPTYNTKEATLSAQAQRKISEIQSSDLTPEEKQQKVQQVNAILSREIMKARGQGQ